MKRDIDELEDDVFNDLEDEGARGRLTDALLEEDD